MGFDQYHEPAQELSAETRTFARMIASLTEEAEASRSLFSDICIISAIVGLGVEGLTSPSRL